MIKIQDYLKQLGIPQLIVCIGDSHVISLTNSQYLGSINCRLYYVDQQKVLFISLWFKDTLAYSVSKKLFSKKFVIKSFLLGMLRVLGARFYFNFGEIDIRCHLAKVDKHTDFLPSYVHNCRKLVRASSNQIFFLTPTPPSDLYENHPSFPRYGDLSERIKAYMDFCSNLSIAVEQQSCRYIDLSSVLFSSSEGLRAELTDDGCHLNQKGATLVRKLILEHK